MERQTQTFENHAKFVPSYHFLTFTILLTNLALAAWRLFRGPSPDTVVALLLAVALVLMFFHLRVFPLKVQDRVIRLEMRLRLAEVLPEDLRPRIRDLTPGQLVALRFAGDAELPGLVRQVLEGKLEGRTAIKKAIKDWQPDYLRC
jgi:hypothetical protein